MVPLICTGTKPIIQSTEPKLALDSYHTPLVVNPVLEGPPGKWQKCDDPPLLDPYTRVPIPVMSTAAPLPWRKSAGGTGLPAAKPRLSSGNPEPPPEPWNKLNGKCGLYPQQPDITPQFSTVLILFSGPSSNPANLQHALRKLNLKVEAYDILDGANLADNAIWEPIKVKLAAGFYSAVFASPPCNSFIRLRGSDTTGPQRVRSVEGPERYGLNTNSPKDKEYVRVHNLFASRCAHAFNTMVDQKRVALLEQPEWRDEEVSMFNLDEYTALLKRPGVEHNARPQCPFGAKAFKSTSYLTYGVSITDMSTKCCHSIKHWFRQGDASHIYARHPPSRGRHTYYLTDAEALADQSTPKRFVATGLANYPALLSSFLAMKILAALRKAPTPVAIAAPKPQHCWDNRAGKIRLYFSKS